MSFAEQGDLEAFVGHDVDDARAELLLDLASASVSGYAGTQIAEATTTDGLVDGNGYHELKLPEWPVSAVDSVTVIEADGDEDLLDGPDTASPEFRWSESGVLTRCGGSWPHRDRSVKVTYTHGFATVPDGIRTATLQAAARALVNPSSLQSWDGDSTRAAFSGLVLELTDGEKQIVDEALR